MKMHGGEALVEVLKAYGVEMMFGLPGDQTHIYDALARNSSIRHILVRHEECAALMADAYARATGKVGICDATVGPGATNLISGIGESFTSGLPVLAIVSDIRSDWRGRGSLQEIDQVGVFKPITKAALTVEHTSRMPEIARRAFQIATTGKPGPVLLNCPLNALKGEADFPESDFHVDTRYGRFPPHRQLPPAEEIDEALNRLLAAKRPVIACGGGVLSSGASAQVQALAEALEIPVVTTFMGKGSLPENHALALGPFGLLGRPVTNDWVLGADFVLAIGTRFTNVDTAGWRIPKPGTEIVQIDIDATELGRNYPVALGLAGDASAVLAAMLAKLVQHPKARRYGFRAEAEALRARWLVERGPDSAIARDENCSPVHPLQAIRALRRVLKPEDVVICDSGFNQIWGGQYFEVQSAGRRYMGPRGFGVMGYSFPAAIATKLAHPHRNVVAFCGDGGFSMVLQELETAKRVGAHVLVVVLNNRNLEYVKQNQKMMYGARYVSVDHLDVDFAAIARAFGCHGERVERSGDLERALRDALASGLPAVVDVRTVELAEPDRLSLQKLSGASLYPTG
jgi:acetolactate synthase-1/2/3 large subunit